MFFVSLSLCLRLNSKRVLLWRSFHTRCVTLVEPYGLTNRSIRYKVSVISMYGTRVLPRVKFYSLFPLNRRKETVSPFISPVELCNNHILTMNVENFKWWDPRTILYVCIKVRLYVERTEEKKGNQSNISFLVRYLHPLVRSKDKVF